MTRWRVQPGDLDLFGHMNNSRYLAVMDLGRIDFGLRLGITGELLKRRWTIPVGHAGVEFKRALKLFEPYEIRTRIAHFDDVWFYMEQEFVRLREPSEVIGTGYVKTLFRGPAGPIPTKEVMQLILGSERDADLPAAPEPSPEICRRFGITPRAGATPEREPIAIVGIGCRLPGGADGPESLWELLLNRKDCIVEIPENRWDKSKFHDATGKSPGRAYVHRAGLVQGDIRAFDAAFFGVMPREAETLDPQQRMLLEVSWEALEDAGIAPTALAGTRAGVFVGGFMPDNLIIFSNPENRIRISSQFAFGGTLTMLSNRLSYFYDLRGPSITIDTACSSSLVALHYACQSIWSGESTVALVGGSNALLAPEVQITMAKAKFLSPRGYCHAFGADADGYVRAEGAAIVVLKPLSAAERDGNPIYAVIRGSAVTQDGRTNGIAVPNPDAQMAAMRSAYLSAGIDPKAVAYLEAHGTGTPTGDPIEARAIGAVIGSGRRDGVLVGSIKSNVGHLEAASGVTGLIKAALCLKHRAVPPSLHCERPNPEIPFDELGIRLATELEPLPSGSRELVAGVNSFGYGGTNAHVVLAEAPPRPVTVDSEVVRARPPIFPLSAKSAPALSELAERWADHLGGPRSQLNGSALASMCRTAAVHRAHHRYRWAWSGQSAGELVEALRSLASTSLDESAKRDRADRARVVFVYTGMGPQWWAMGQALMRAEPVFRNTVQQCDAIFRRIAGFSIAAEMARDEASSKMDQTAIAQPANLVLQLSLTRLLASWGIRPSAVLGHSVGEIAAAYAAGALTLEDAIVTVYHRSRLQQRLTGRGTMLAVGLPASVAESRLSDWGSSIAIAAINGPGSVTLAGEKSALDAVARSLEAENVFHRFLQVGVPYHSTMMDEIRSELATSLASLKPEAARLPIYSTVTGALGTTLAYDAGYWWGNVREPVRFSEAFGAVLDDGYDVFLQIGPHPVLSAPMKEILAERSVRGDVIASLERGASEPGKLAQALSNLYLAGVDLDWAGYCGPGAYVPSPSYAWQRKSYWTESERAAAYRGPFGGHPLLTAHEPGPAPEWYADLNLSKASYLLDHVVGGIALLPAAAQLELVMAVSHAIHGTASCSIEDIELSAPVALTESEQLTLIVHAAPDSPVFRIESRVGQAVPQPCARAKVFSAGQPTPPIKLGALVARLDESLEPEELYESLARAGLAYGPAFRAVTRVRRCGTLDGGRRGSGEVLARLELPESVDERGYHVHPVLLDAALHSLLGAAAGDLPNATIVPQSIERFQIFASDSVTRKLSAYGRVVTADGTQIRGDVTLIGDDGKTVGEIRGICCRVLPAKNDVDGRLSRWLTQRSFVPLELSASNGKSNGKSNGNSNGATNGAGVHADHEVTWIHLTADLGAVAAAQLVQSAASDKPVWIVDRRWSEGQARPEIESPVEAGLDAAHALVETIQALAAGSVDRYFLVTQGAEAVSPDEAPALGLAPLLGVARVAMTERADLKLTLVDFDELPPIPVLERRLAKIGSEQELALRGDAAYAARVQPFTLPEPDPAPRIAPAPGSAYALVLGEKGRLDSLRFRACERPPPGPGQVEVEVDYAPLAFRDVAKALGLLSERITRAYFGDTIGGEGVGRVSALGSGVTELAIGDFVYGTQGAFMRSHVIANADRLMKLPDEKAVPHAFNLLNFLTAHYALIQMGRLRAGERVLIHSASGGVGLAAIEVAREVGAEIFATAGTDEKRRFVESRGVARTASSRDVSFADEARSWTGGRGVDVVLNFAPGEIMHKGLSCLAPYGRFVEIGKASFDKDSPLHLRLFNDNLSYFALDAGHVLETRRDEAFEILRSVLARLESGAYRPTPTTVLPAREVAEAFRTLARGEHMGKLCLSFEDDELTVEPLPRTRFRSDATYLVTGGLGGFGLEVARRMASEGARHIALVSRNGAKSPEAREALDAFRAQGIDARAFAADVGHRAELERVVTEIKTTMPPLRGIFHAATVYEDKLLSTLDRPSLAKVLSAKANGAWNLHTLTLDLPLDLFVLFSSVSSLIGNAGQASYVAANAFVEQLGAFRRSRGLPAITIQWGALAEAGAVARDARLGRHLERVGVNGIGTRDALAALERIIAADVGEVAVVDAAWGRIHAGLDAWAGRRRLESLIDQTAADDAKTNGAAARSALASMDSEAALATVIERLTRAAGKVMRLPPSELDPTQPLREVGLDSLIAIEIAATAEAELGFKVPAMLFAGGPSLRDLAGTLLTQQQA